MPLLGALLKRTLELRKTMARGQTVNGGRRQRRTLRKLLRKARNTAFGQHYGFRDMLQSGDSLHAFQERVPIHDYNAMFDPWWHRSLQGEDNVSWPGHVNYFALSSGTSGASSKHIPVTDDMLRAIRRTSVRQMLSLSNYDLPQDVFVKKILMLGGSTHLHHRGRYFEGDLSGIGARNIPFWFQHYYKPGRTIARERDWSKKLEEITRKAPEWDVGIIVGVPAWIQILLEKIIAHHGLRHIHEVWPNLRIYVHGGVAFQPYKKGFEKLLGEPLTYIETYLASEGFIAFQARPGTQSMQLILNNGLFFEFIPFTADNFTQDGQLKEKPRVLSIDEVTTGKDYALLLSTCAGTWRYLIGDTVRFTSLDNYELVITGRTKHFLSLCGEHLSVDNMNQAITHLEEALDVTIREFTVAGIPHESLFAHKWYIGTEKPVSQEAAREQLDTYLQTINDDYRVERGAALKAVFVETVDVSIFYQWMKRQGKEGGQHKFPRVMSGEQFRAWEVFAESEKSR